MTHVLFLAFKQKGHYNITLYLYLALSDRLVCTIKVLLEHVMWWGWGCDPPFFSIFTHLPLQVKLSLDSKIRVLFFFFEVWVFSITFSENL